MPLSRREFLIAGGLTIGGVVLDACSPTPELSRETKLQPQASPLQEAKPATTVTPSPESYSTPQSTSRPTSSEIKPLWEEGRGDESPWRSVYQDLKDGENLVLVSNIEPNEEIFLADPEKKPFYNSPAAGKMSYGEVITVYKEWKDPHFLEPLAQDYETLGHLNVFLIGPYQDFPYEARTLKEGVKGQISAEAVIRHVTDDGIIIEEVHYSSDDKPIFRCFSQFNKVDKELIKVAESNIQGKKVEEYFFLWPSMTKEE